MSMNDIIYKAANVKPSERQLALQDMEFYSFVHFTVNTFTDEDREPFDLQPDRIRRRSMGTRLSCRRDERAHSDVQAP